MPFSKATALGRTCYSRSMNFNSGIGALVATNRILSLLSPFVVMSASEGGRGRQGITLMSAKRHGKQIVGGMCSWNSKMSFPPSRSNGKLRSLNSSWRQQAGQETPMGRTCADSPSRWKCCNHCQATNPTRSFSGVGDDHFRSGDKMLDHSMRESCGGGRQSFETNGKFTYEFSRSGSQVVPNFRRCKMSPMTHAYWSRVSEQTLLYWKSVFCLQSQLDSSFKRVSPWWSNICFVSSRASLSISSPRGRSHNMKSKSARQTIWRSTSNKPPSPRSLKLRTLHVVAPRCPANRMGYDESCSRQLSARNPLIANATSKSREQRSLCSCNAFSSPQLPPRATPNVSRSMLSEWHWSTTLAERSTTVLWPCCVHTFGGFHRWAWGSLKSQRQASVHPWPPCTTSFHGEATARAISLPERCDCTPSWDVAIPQCTAPWQRLRRSLQLAPPMGPHPLGSSDGGKTRILADSAWNLATKT